jgi:hypothetical protein
MGHAVAWGKETAALGFVKNGRTKTLKTLTLAAGRSGRDARATLGTLLCLGAGLVSGDLACRAVETTAQCLLGFAVTLTKNRQPITVLFVSVKPSTS